jgi:(Z)-2-((N-methylformamido)methylene)-5-hydroxybutyrolactone dehydrogenase
VAEVAIGSAVSISNEFVVGDGPPLEAINPFTGEVWATVATSRPADVDAAVASAAEAFESWRRVPGLRRAELLNRLAELIERDADSLAVIESSDNGKIIRETKVQMRFAARNYRFFAGAADRITGETKTVDSNDVVDFTLREPIGVAGLVTPWNSPIGILANKLAPALAAGNTVVIKPSEHTSISTVKFAELMAEAGFPSGVFNVVVGGPEVGQALATNPSLGRLSFTGSVPVGRLMAQYASQAIVPVTLELGGKSANVIFDDADLARAIPGAVAGIFAAAGQTCIAGSRLLVHRKVYDEVVSALAERAENVKVGDPLDEATDMGPVAHAGQQRAILEHIVAAEASGARLVAGGSAATKDLGGRFISPTIFADVDPDSQLAQEEIFGPVLAVIPFDDEAQAIAIANNTTFGLASGVWTSNLGRAHRMAKELRAGTVWVNTYRASFVQAPFGGTKQSGYGRERGIEALDDYLQMKNVMIELSEEPRDPFRIKA